jgi:two-component system, OmpR family, response regulator MprA
VTRVLLIEDDPDVITLLQEILAHEGYEVSVAHDGLEGLLLLRTGTPDIALLDIMMPDIDGLRVLDQLVEEGGTPVPLIVITGSPEGAARARDVLGRDRVFEKPFAPDALIDRMAALTRSTP